VPLLEVKDLVVRYGRVAALRGVSVSVSEGEAVAIVGANGAGKSSLLGAITGIVPIASGSIEFAGKPIAGRKPEQIVAAGVSLVPEGRHIFGTLTVAENLRLGLTTRSDRDAGEADLKTMLERFPRLKDYYRTHASKLSGGEQQQLAIVRSLLTAPRLLMLDEPSLGLAPKVVDLIFEILAELRESGVTILLVEQNAARAVEFAERSYLLKTGEVAREGSRSQLRDEGQALTEAYLGYGREAG
jgi:branched-chain amino acid transport system ATP-binding protein